MDLIFLDIVKYEEASLFVDRDRKGRIKASTEFLCVHNPGEIDHQFRNMSSTDSGGCRPLIPEQAVHFLIGSGIE
jgi:hypothetical protein